MGNSYRIRTTPGQDKNLVIQVDQDFEQLEILSLKIRQDDVYLRMCADYGVIAGRVFANNGYGLPNAKVPDDIEKFVKTYIDVDEIFESMILNKLKELYKDLSWDFPPLNENVNKFFSFL